MDPAALLKLMDLAIGAMNTVSRVNSLIATARAEGRTVTMEEVDALVEESRSSARTGAMLVDLGFQRRLTGWFVAGYFLMIVAFLGLGAAAYIWDDALSLSSDAQDVLKWIQATLGPLIGVLTGAVKDQLQFHYGSSVGSKSKDARPMA